MTTINSEKCKIRMLYGQEEEGMTEDDMVGWHHQFIEHELE